MDIDIERKAITSEPIWDLRCVRCNGNRLLQKENNYYGVK